MKIDHLGNIGFDEVHLNLLFSYIKGFNENKHVDTDNMQELSYINSLVCKNSNSSN